jgi:hypothetical protein
LLEDGQLRRVESLIQAKSTNCNSKFHKKNLPLLELLLDLSGQVDFLLFQVENLA